MTILIEGTTVRATSPEGEVATMTVADLARLLAERRANPYGTVFPDGLKSIVAKGPVTIWVHETPPRVHSLRWIDAESPLPFGPAARYRTVRIALPYVVVLAAFVENAGRRVALSQANECFFRTSPLRHDGDALLYPGLLNCSKFAVTERRPLSWICTQHIDLSRMKTETDPAKRFRLGLDAVLRCLFDTGFNYSSEHHELTSWYSESAKADARIATVESWEEHSRSDSLFGLDVRWIPAGLTVEQVAARTATNLASLEKEVSSSADIARIVFRHGIRERKAEE